jgi:hypothetical protein
MPKLTPNDLEKFNKSQAPEDKISVQKYFTQMTAKQLF